MSGHDHASALPRGALPIAGALVIFALGATALARVTQLPPSASPALVRAEKGVTPLRSRDLRFTDRADGAVVIFDTNANRIASVVEPGQETGFIRGVMRGLARERRMNGIGNTPPFRLTLWRDGQLSLVDTATGRDIQLDAFGGTNRAAFAALLPATAR